MLYSEEELKRLQAISASLGGSDNSSSKKKAATKSASKSKTASKSKSKSKAPAKKNKKVKSLVAAGLAGGALIAGLNGAPQIINAVNSARDAGNNGIETTVDNTNTADEALEEMNVTIDENEDPTLTDAITLSAKYSNNIETLKELKENVDDENFHFVRKGVKTKEGQGVIDFDKSLDNIIAYYQTKVDALDLMLADNVIDADEMKILYHMVFENERTSESTNEENSLSVNMPHVTILAEIENYKEAVKALTDATNSKEGTNISKITEDRIYTGKENEEFNLFMAFDNETQLQEWIDKIAKENSIEDIKLTCIASEFDDGSELAGHEIDLYGEEVAQPKKHITPNAPVVPETPPVVPPNGPEPPEPPKPPVVGQEEEAGDEKENDPNVEDEGGDEKGGDDDKKAKPEYHYETGEEAEDDDEAEPEDFGDEKGGEEYGDEEETGDEEAEEEDFGDEKSFDEEEESFDEEEESWEEEFGD